MPEADDFVAVVWRSQCKVVALGGGGSPGVVGLLLFFGLFGAGTEGTAGASAS